MKEINGDITKDLLVNLGFVKEFSTPEESGEKNGFYYYCYDVGGNCLLITDSNTESDGNYSVEIFEHEKIKITNYVDLVDLVRILKRSVVK